MECNQVNYKRAGIISIRSAQEWECERKPNVDFIFADFLVLQRNQISCELVLYSIRRCQNCGVEYSIRIRTAAKKAWSSVVEAVYDAQFHESRKSKQRDQDFEHSQNPLYKAVMNNTPSKLRTNVDGNDEFEQRYKSEATI